MKQPIKMTPGDELHLTALMAPFSLNLVTGQDRQHLLGYGRAAFEAGKAGQCLHQIQEPAAAEQAAWHAGLDEGRAQAAPAAVAVPDERAAFEKHMAGANLHRTQFDDYENNYVHGKWEAWQARAALAATPAAAPDTLSAIAIEELSQLGYTFDGNKMMPPDFVGELMHVVQTAPCGCREGTCETKSDRACRMTAEIAANTTPAAAAPVALPEHWGVCAGNRIWIGKTPEHVLKLAEQEGMQLTLLFTERQLRAALLAGVSAPAAQAVTAPTAQDSCCAWSVWWTHDKAKHTTTRQASIAAWDAGIAYAIERIAPQAQADARDDSALLDAMELQRIAVVPEYEGPWDAEVYNGDEKPNQRGTGSTPREAIRAAIAAAKGESQ